MKNTMIDRDLDRFASGSCLSDGKEVPSWPNVLHLTLCIDNSQSPWYLKESCGGINILTGGQKSPKSSSIEFVNASNAVEDGAPIVDESGGMAFASFTVSSTLGVPGRLLQQQHEQKRSRISGD